MIAGICLSVEARVVIQASGCSLASHQKESLVRLLSGKIDWNLVYELADRNRVGPRVFRTLMSTAPTLIPSDFIGRWQIAIRKNLKHNLFVIAELSRVSVLLEKHGIKVVSFKGPALAAMLHGTVALRPFTDLDLVVESSDVARKAKDILVSEGYHLHEPMNPTEEGFYLKTQCEYHIICPRNQVFIDLHWKIFYSYFSYAFDIADAFSRLVNVSVGGGTCTTFCPEDLLLILSAHSSRHLWEDLCMIADVADLLEKFQSLDWSSVLHRASILGGKRMLLLAVHLAETLFHSAIPNEISSLIRRDLMVRRLGREVIQRISAPTQVSPRFLDEFAFQIRCRERLYHRLRFMFLGLFSPGLQEFNRFPLPEPLFPLLLLLRPLRLFNRLFAPPTSD